MTQFVSGRNNMSQPRGPGLANTVAEPFPNLEGPSHKAPIERSSKPLEPDPPTYPSGAFPDYATPYNNYSHQGGAVTTSQPDPLQVEDQLAVPDIRDYMVVNVLLMLCCCPLCGIVGVMKSRQCKQAKMDGDFPKAVERSLQAKNWGTAALTCGMICLVNVLVLLFFYRLY